MNHAITIGDVIGVISGIIGLCFSGLGLQMIQPSTVDTLGWGCIALIIGLGLLALSAWAIFA